MTPRGYVQVYTGDGKGKTTAALGLALRASGRGLRSYIGQFMKGQFYGELAELRDHPRITIEQYGDADLHPARGGHRGPPPAGRVGPGPGPGGARLGGLRPGRPRRGERGAVVRAAQAADVLELLDARPPQVELVLTGRYAPQAVLDRADLVTEMREVHHYYQQGVPAREGIEK